MDSRQPRCATAYQAPLDGPERVLTFFTWLQGPAFEADEIEYDFLLTHTFLHKCMFFKHLSREEIIGKLVAQREAARAKMKTLDRIRRGMLTRGVDPCRIATLELGIAQHRYKIRWLEKMTKEVRENAHLRSEAAAKARPRGGKSARLVQPVVTGGYNGTRKTPPDPWCRSCSWEEQVIAQGAVAVGGERCERSYRPFVRLPLGACVSDGIWHSGVDRASSATMAC